MMSVVALIGINNRKQMEELTAARTWVTHTHEVISALYKLRATIDEAEAGQRGYLVTNDLNYLEPYNEAKSKVEDLVEHLIALTVDNPQQTNRFKVLRQLIKSKFDLLEELIQIQRKAGFEAARVRVLNNGGRAQMENIRNKIAEIVEDENILLRERTEKVEDHLRRASNQLLMFTVAAAIFQSILAILGAVSLKSRQRALAKLRAVLNSMDEGLIQTDSSGNVSYINPAAERMLALTKQKARGLALSEVFKIVDDSEDKSEPMINREQLVRGNEGQIINFDGARMFVQYTGAPINDGNAYEGAVISFQDITEVHQSELELAEREARITAIVDFAADGIFTVAGEGVIETANRAAHHLFGYSSSELIGMNISSLLPEFALGKTSELHTGERTISAGLELNGISKNGKQIPIELTMSIVNLGNRNIVTGIVRDIAERKEVERRVSEFYSTVSHELRTPLTSIRGSLGLLEGGRAGTLSERATQLVIIARLESDRLIRLINDILDIRKIEAGKFELNVKEFSPDQIIRQTVDAMASLISEHDIQIKTEIAKSLPMKGDPDRIVQVLTNLLSNAIKFSPRDSEMVLAVDYPSENLCRFSVTDRGNGIAPEHVHKLFGLFQQLDASDSRSKGGTGLGLAISKAIVEQHGGNIFVDTQLGHGSTFSFTLPVDTVQPQIVKQTNKQKIALIIEDDRQLCAILTDVLQEQGFTSISKHDVADSKEFLLNQSAPDVILLDIGLPDGNGFELMEWCGGIENLKGVPVVVLSGGSEAQSLGAPMLVSWLKKPIDSNVLEATLRSACRRAGVPRILLVEDDVNTRQVVKHYLEGMNIECFEAGDGTTALELADQKEPDLIILDLAIPIPDGYDVVSILRLNELRHTPMLVYSATDLSSQEKEKLTLGLTAYLVKSRTSESEFLSTVKGLLQSLISNLDNQTLVKEDAE